MFVSYMLIAMGVTTVLWGTWLLPRQLSQVRNKLPPDQLRYFDDRFRRDAMRRLFAMPTLCGTLLVLTGVMFLLVK